MNTAIHLADILMDIEKELRELRMWDAISPTDEALRSVQPFAIDTLTFPQWLQFIFIPRMYFILETRAELPTNCGIAPMGEEYFASLNVYSAPLLEHLRRIDRLLT